MTKKKEKKDKKEAGEESLFENGKLKPVNKEEYKKKNGATENSRSKPKKNVKKTKPETEKVEKQKPEVTAEDLMAELKPLGVNFREDKLQNIGLRLDVAFGYVSRRQYGLAYHRKEKRKDEWQWYQAGRIETKKEMMEKVSLIKEYVKNKKPETLVKLDFLKLSD